MQDLLNYWNFSLFFENVSTRSPHFLMQIIFKNKFFVKSAQWRTFLTLKFLVSWSKIAMRMRWCNRINSPCNIVQFESESKIYCSLPHLFWQLQKKAGHYPATNKWGNTQITNGVSKNGFLIVFASLLIRTLLIEQINRQHSFHNSRKTLRFIYASEKKRCLEMKIWTKTIGKMKTDRNTRVIPKVSFQTPR